MKDFVTYDMKNEMLVSASENGDVDKVRFFLELGVNVNAWIRFSHGNRPLHYAALKGHLEIAQILLQNAMGLI